MRIAGLITWVSGLRFGRSEVANFFDVDCHQEGNKFHQGRVSACDLRFEMFR